MIGSQALHFTPVGAAVPFTGYDTATDTLENAEAILNTLSNSYDDEHGFLSPDKMVWLTILAVRALVETARASLVTTA